MPSSSRIGVSVCALALLAACSESHVHDAGSDGGSRRDALTFDAPAVRPDAQEVDGGCLPRRLVDPRILPVCTFCTGGHCVPGDALPAESRAQLADCSPTQECVPDDILEAGGNVTLESCRSTFDVEGRCLSTCLPAVVAAGDRIPRGSCGENHRCVPCFDPLTGAETGACSFGCDLGPTEPPFVVDSCCGDRGYCIPSTLIEPSSHEYFSECTPEALCIPRVFVATPGWTPPACTSASGAGACLHDCMPAVAPYRAFLEQNDCPEDLLCVPCRNPADGRATGACADVRDDAGAPAADGGSAGDGGASTDPGADGGAMDDGGGSGDAGVDASGMGG